MSGRQALVTDYIPRPFHRWQGKLELVMAQLGTVTDTHSLIRQLKPLKAPKKGPKGGDEDEDDAAFKAKQKADAAALKQMQDRAKQGGPLGAGLKKSGAGKK
ncbi:hypothetical protein OIO90_003957 [Microbotryomycetes sp. JL221]|nr:hypothetical protein OIO90_003957 [Microbotryomycetes sp. JL221]